jgi:hypothetical protein
MSLMASCVRSKSMMFNMTCFGGKKSAALKVTRSEMLS